MRLDANGEDHEGDAAAVKPSLDGEDDVVVKEAGEDGVFGEDELATEEDALGEAFEDLFGHLGDFFDDIGSDDAVRFGVFQNMSFNMGVGGVMEFHHDLADTQAGNYAASGADMQASAWYTQVGARAQRLVQQMITGIWT